MDAQGNPTAYGPLVNIAAGKWGTTSLGPLNTLVTRNNSNQPGADATHPSASTSGQVLGGVSLNVVQDLIAGGGVSGNFTKVVDTLNTNGLTRTDVIAPNGVLISISLSAWNPGME